MPSRPRSRSGQPPIKRRKISMGKAPAEILFDQAAREDYLTGFHKRKLQRIKQAQELAKQAEKEEKRVHRREIREERKKELEEHVLAVKRAMEAVNGLEATPAGIDDSDEESNEEWTGFPDAATDSVKDAEYIDEDAYATVTVENVDISKDGFVTRNSDEEDSESDAVAEVVATAVKDVTGAEAAKLSGEGKKRVWTKDKPLGLRRPSKKKREKKFRYESKTERKVNREKQRTKNRAQAAVRKEKAGK